MLTIFNNFSTNGFSIQILTLISIISLVFGILVINSKNPIVSVLFLIGLFLGISSYLFFLGLHFIGMAYLLVYVGAVSILFLFILMLINVRVSELLSNTSNSFPLSFLVSIAFYAIIQPILPNGFISFNNIENFIQGILGLSNIIFYATSTSWDQNLMESSHITSIGNVLYTVYSLWIVLTAIVLLLAMVGAIAITIKQKINSFTRNSDLIYNTIYFKFIFGSNEAYIVFLPFIIKGILNIESLCTDYFLIESIFSITDENIDNYVNKSDIKVVTVVEITEGGSGPMGTTTTITGGTGVKK